MKEEVERYIHDLVDGDVEPHFERCRIDPVAYVAYNGR